MTQFNPQGKQRLTYGEALAPAMKIIEQADADQYFKAYVEFMQLALEREPNSDGLTAEAVCKINLGYYAGYYGIETRERVERLFITAHPIFGKIVNDLP